VNLDGLPLSRKQVLSIVDARKARIAIWAGAVRSGKTVASLVAFLCAVADVVDSKMPGLIIVAGRTLQTIERNLLEPLQDPGLFGPLASQVQHTRGSSTADILGRTVHLIGASDVRSEGRLRGLTACLGYADEATLMPKAFWSQFLARLSVPGARLLATTNPDGPSHWLRKDFILREGELDLRHWHFTLDDNPSLTDKFIADIKAEASGLDYRRMVLGEWCMAEGAVFDMWDPDVHVVDIVPPISEWLSVGIDYGTRAPTAALLLGLSNRGGGEGGDKPCLYFVDEFRWDSSQTRRQLTDVELSAKLREWQQAVRFPGTRLHGPQAKYVVVDPSAASLKVQLFQDGWSTVDADNSVIDGIRLVSSLLTKRQLKVSRKCQGWIDEITGYSWDDKAALLGEDRPIKTGDHSLDAGRYAVKTTQALWHSSIPLTLAAPQAQAAGW